MATITSAPGVYIEEDATPSLSVNPNATAVPVFIGRFTPKEESQLNTLVRISSWLDYTSKFIAEVSYKAVVTVTTQKKKSKKSENSLIPEFKLESDVDVYTAHPALYVYFQNGGGPCYIYSCFLDEGDTTSLAQLPGFIENHEDITLLCVTEVYSDYQNIVNQQLLTLLNKNKGYFLITDSENGKVNGTLATSSHVSVYYPQLTIADPGPYNKDDVSVIVAGIDINDLTLADLKKKDRALADTISDHITEQLANFVLTVPASVAMAGIYCKNDAERGVWKAPANYAINGISDVSVRITNAEQGIMNQAGINAIRYFSGRGPVVWGARTLEDNDNWRYISVRRLFDAAERDIKNAMRIMVFEPNNQPTWTRVRAAIDHYLYRLWQQGGLAGNKPEEAYFVNVGKHITMTDDEIAQGKMIVKIGMAAVRPAEFIILLFTQDMAR